MVRRVPVIRIEQADGAVSLGDGKQCTDTAWRVAVVGVVAVELEMPHAGRIDPILWEAIGDQEMVGAQRLISHAVDAALQQAALLLVVGRDDGVVGIFGHCAALFLDDAEARLRPETVPVPIGRSPADCLEAQVMHQPEAMRQASSGTRINVASSLG